LQLQKFKMDADRESRTRRFWTTYSDYLHEERDESVKTKSVWSTTGIIRELLKLHRVLDLGEYNDEKIHEIATSVLMYVVMTARDHRDMFTLVYPDQADYNALIDCPPPSEILEYASYLCHLMTTEMESEDDGEEPVPYLHIDRWEKILRDILLALVWYTGNSLQDLAYEHHKKMEPGLYAEVQNHWEGIDKRLYKD